MFKVNTELVNDVYVLHFKGKADSTALNELQNVIDTIMGEERTKVIADMKALEYINSVSIRLLLVLYKYISEENGQLIICEMNSVISKVFEISGLDQILNIKQDYKESLNELL